MSLLSSAPAVRPLQDLSERYLAPELDLTELTLPVPGLPDSLAGLRLAQISDLHRGPGSWGPLHLERASQAVRSALPDLLINTGDYVWRTPALDQVAQLIRRFPVPHSSSHPSSLAILGNHDYSAPAPVLSGLRALLPDAGITLLENQAAAVRRGTGQMWVVGLTADARDTRLSDGLRALQQAGRPRIVLVHEPSLAMRLPADSADLILAGHTHGGQVAIPGLTPFITLKMAGSSFVHGMYRVNGMPLYVNRGLGCVGLPLRYRANPEVTIVRLVAVR